MSLIPTSNKAEWHITYACNLDCHACNRASFLRKPHTPDMTMDDAREFIWQARELEWKPRIIVIGGEPTLHKDFLQFVEIATSFSETYCQVFSNAYSSKSRMLCAEATRLYNASICEETKKLGGAIDIPTKDWVEDCFVSPTDFGEKLREPCWQHSSKTCGISVDSEGYAPCSIGGSVDALLKLGARTKILKDLFDESKVARSTGKLCLHCGVGNSKPGQVASCEKKFNTAMSPTWIKAFEGRR